MAKSLNKLLKELEACDQACDWVKTQRGKTPRQIYKACVNGLWLDWFVWKLCRVRSQPFNDDRVKKKHKLRLPKVITDGKRFRKRYPWKRVKVLVNAFLSGELRTH